MSIQSHYPSFHVLDEQEAWDDHSQRIVLSRLEPARSLRFFTAAEAGLVRRICSLLVHDETPDVLDYIVAHLDDTLHQSPGEGQRKAGIPPGPALIRAGLNAVAQGAQQVYGSAFEQLATEDQKHYLQQISAAKAEPPTVWGATPQREWFDKLLTLTVESYCSHPSVWSEIGYAGPAYPRGYVRTQLGQLDPWEAQPE